MPEAAPKPCTYPGCGRLVRTGGSRCDQHQHAGKFADKTRGSRHQRGYGAAWERLREQILMRDRGLCQPCKAKGLFTAARQVDHIKPKAEGGTDHPANLQAICVTCHKAKTAREGAGGVSKV